MGVHAKESRVRPQSPLVAANKTSFKGKDCEAIQRAASPPLAEKLCQNFVA